MAESILKDHKVTVIQHLAKNKRAERALEDVGLQPRSVTQVIQNIEQITEGLKESDLPRGAKGSASA